MKNKKNYGLSKFQSRAPKKGKLNFVERMTRKLLIDNPDMTVEQAEAKARGAADLHKVKKKKK